MTIKDLAAQTGYSVGTVSRVLNNQPHVSEMAREVILRAAKESGFQLNSNAKQLKQHRGNSLLVICKGNVNELFDTLLVSIQAKLADTEYPLIVDYIDESENEVRRAAQLCWEKKPLGILFLGGSRENFQADFHNISIPCVVVTTEMKGLPFQNLSSVSSDDVQAAALAVEQLLLRGHQKIMIIGGSRDYSDIARLRYAGCIQAFQKAGVAFSESFYETARFTYQDAYRAAQTLLKRHPDMTAIFAMSDVMAIAAIRALTDAGKAVPREISVIGFDGLEIGGYMVPRLTTVGQSASEISSIAIDLLLKGLAEGPQCVHKTVPVTLLWRESAQDLQERCC